MIKNNLYELLEKFKDRKIMVVGDLVLDEYWYGNIGRVSREAPVLILDYEETISVLGGAANAVNNLSSLGAEVVPISVVGNDDSGRKLINLFKEKKIDPKGIVIDDSDHTRTPTKIRVMAGCIHTSKQQTLRIDKKSKETYSSKIQDKIINNIKEKLDEVEGILVSDYGVGVLSNKVISYINSIGDKKNIPIVVDSRYDLNKYRHVTLVTPNEEEVEIALKKKIDYDNLERVSKELFVLVESLGAVMITLGREGMALFDGKNFSKIPIVGTNEVVDVTGAGDTVSSVITLAMATKSNFLDAMTLANTAASLVVMKRGNATVSVDDIKSIVG